MGFLIIGLEKYGINVKKFIDGIEWNAKVINESWKG
jgi:hypothetical protein